MTVEAKKAFDDLTIEEATKLAKISVRGMKTEDKIRRCLSIAGFSDGATIKFIGFGPEFEVTVRGPSGEAITVRNK